MAILEVLSALGSMASIAGEARIWKAKIADRKLMPQHPDYSAIPSDMEPYAEAVDQYLFTKFESGIITEAERQQVKTEFYKRYPEFEHDHEYTDELINQTLNQLEDYLKVKMTPGERVIKSKLDDMSTVLLSMAEQIQDLKGNRDFSLVSSTEKHGMKPVANAETHNKGDVGKQIFKGTIAYLNIGVQGREMDYKNVALEVILVEENAFHIESIGDNHGVRFTIEYNASTHKLNVNYHFSARSTADLLKNAVFAKNCVETGVFAFYDQKGNMAIGPIPAGNIFTKPIEEIENARKFFQALLLIENFFDVKFSAKEEFSKEDQEWVWILSEGIHNRAVPFTWDKASYSGVLHPAKEGLDIREAVNLSELKYGYTEIGYLEIGNVHFNDIMVRYLLESAKIENKNEIQKSLDGSTNGDAVAVTVKLVPSLNNAGTRQVIFK